MSNEFKQQLNKNAGLVTATLNSLLDEALLSGEIIRPPRLMAAVRHAVLNGGKRFRPFLLIEVAALFGHRGEGVVKAACALECLHCYSLVHDDLPSMDDDDIRRGKPTVHRAFDEALAILAGDALLTFSFDLLSDPATSNDPDIRATLVQLLARAAGQGGMIGGQVLDIAAETSSLSEPEILRLQAMKTGALIRFGCEAGAVLGSANRQERETILRYGEVLGQAFQLADDLLDVTSDSRTLGKAAGKDAARGKKTLVDFYGVEGSRARLQDLQDEATGLLAQFGLRADILREAACFVAERDR